MEKRLRVLSFDLSTTCTGVTAIEIVDNKIHKMNSCSIIPNKFDLSTLGFKKSKKKVFTSNKKINTVTSFVKEGETIVSEKEARKRNALVRKHRDNFNMNFFSDRFIFLIKKFSPNLILVEKNEIFNGVLTSVLLSKLMGTLIASSRTRGIDVVDIRVNEARGILNLRNIILNLTGNLSEIEISKIGDVTKEALRIHMNNKYREFGLNCKNTDESDSTVIFNYWYERIMKK